MQVTVAGRSRSRTKRIIEQTQTNIYFPCPILFADDLANKMTPSENRRVYVTGTDKIQVQNAIAELKKAMQAITIVSREVVVPRKKFVFAIQQRSQALCSMIQHSAALILPDWNSFANNTAQVTLKFSGAKNAIIDRALSEFMTIIGEMVAANLHLSSSVFVGPETPASAYPSLVQKLIKIGISSGADLISAGNTLEMTGDSLSMPLASRAVKDLEALHLRIQETHFQVEMSAEYKDFITGKKNGKLNKITKTCGVNLQVFEPYPYVLVLELSSRNYAHTFEAFQQLQDELPAEKEFYVSDVHHKRIIGVGGKNIQGIMKEYGVYVKFLSSDDFKSLGGAYERENNVIARTPAKNFNNLEKLYSSVIALVNVKERDFKNSSVNCSRRYHRFLVGKKRRAIEDKTHTSIEIPHCDSGINAVTVRGLESDIQLAVHELKESVPEKYEYLAPKSDELAKFLTSNSFAELKSKVQKALGISISAGKVDREHASIIIQGNHNNSNKLSICVNMFEASISAEKIPVFSLDIDEEFLKSVTTGNAAIERYSQDVLLFQSFSATRASRGSDFTLASAKTPMSGSAPDLKSLATPLRVVTHQPRSAMKISAVTRPKLVINAQSPVSKSIYDHTRMKSAVEQIAGSNPFGSLNITNVNTRLAPGVLSNTVAGLISPRADVTHGLFKRDISLSANGFNNNGFFNEHADSLSDLHELEEYSGDQDDELMRSVIKSFLPLVEIQGSTTSLNDFANNRLSLLLEHLGLQKYKQTFFEHDVDFEMFLTLTTEDFRELGISLGARKKFAMAIAEIVQGRLQESHSGKSQLQYPPPGLQAPLLSPMVHNMLGSNSKPFIAASVPTSPAHYWTQSGQEWSNDRASVMMHPASSSTSPSLVTPTRTTEPALYVSSSNQRLGFVDFEPLISPFSSPSREFFPTNPVHKSSEHQDALTDSFFSGKK